MGSPDTEILRDHGPVTAEEFARRLWPNEAPGAPVAASLPAPLLDHGYVVCLAGPGDGLMPAFLNLIIG